MLWAGRLVEVREVARTLQSQLEPHRRAYGKLIEGEIAQAERKPIEAIEAFRAAQKLSDLWLVRLNLGILYVEAGRHAEALSELDLCQKRKARRPQFSSTMFRRIGTLRPSRTGSRAHRRGLV